MKRLLCKEYIPNLEGVLVIIYFNPAAFPKRKTKAEIVRCLPIISVNLGRQF